MSYQSVVLMVSLWGGRITTALIYSWDWDWGEHQRQHLPPACRAEWCNTRVFNSLCPNSWSLRQPVFTQTPFYAYELVLTQHNTYIFDAHRHPASSKAPSLTDRASISSISWDNEIWLLPLWRTLKCKVLPPLHVIYISVSCCFIIHVISSALVLFVRTLLLLCVIIKDTASAILHTSFLFLPSCRLHITCFRAEIVRLCFIFINLWIQLFTMWPTSLYMKLPLPKHGSG